MSQQEKWLEFIKKTPPYDIYVGYPMFTVFRDEILKQGGKTFLEYGCGTGYASMNLANQGFKVQGYDDSQGIVDLANKRAETIVIHETGRAKFTSDVTKLKKADVVFSQGLLEHYNDEMIIKLLNEHIKLARKSVVFSVPTVEYPHKDFGDERLMPLSEWESLLRPEYGDKLVDMYCYFRRFFMVGVIEV